MLRKNERLKRSEFNRFFSLGRRLQSKLFQVVFHPHKSFHASVVVSKKVEKSAVKRNKIRRRLYDILRRHKDAGGKSGIYIIIVKGGANKLSYKELKKELLEIIGRTTKSR